MPQPPPLYAPRYLSAAPAMPTMRRIRVVMQDSQPQTLARVKSVFANYAQLVKVVGMQKESPVSFIATVVAAPMSELDINTTAYNLARDMALIQSARAQVLGDDTIAGLGQTPSDSGSSSSDYLWLKIGVAALVVTLLWEL